MPHWANQTLQINIYQEQPENHNSSHSRKQGRKIPSDLKLNTIWSILGQLLWTSWHGVQREAQEARYWYVGAGELPSLQLRENHRPLILSFGAGS